MEHTGNVILVTGAFGEIGSAVCAALASRGRRVCRVSRPPSDGRIASPPAGSGMFADVTADLASEAGWDRLTSAAATPGRIGAFIHCAGSLIPGPLAGLSPGGIGKMIDDNLLSLMLGCRALLPGMIASGRGSIVVLGSLGGIVPMPHVSAYSAVKFGVRGFTLSLAEELMGSGIDVSLISCGPVRSRMLLRESAHPGSIGFINRPLAPARVARTVLEVLEHPRRETIIPRSSGWISRIAGAHARLFGLLYPLASVIGDTRKRAYPEAASVAAAAAGDRP